MYVAFRRDNFHETDLAPKTGKDEYDASKKEDEKEPEATGSVFQGLRADIDGYVTGCSWMDVDMNQVL